VTEVADEDEHAQQQLDDDPVPCRKVQLVLCVLGPLGEPSLTTRDQQADGERDEDDRLDDALDDDDFDKGVVLASKRSELGPKAFEIVRPGTSGLGPTRVRDALETA
jgi:hypothetical protein